MASTDKELLLEWLRDAHAMEKTAVEILEKQDQRLESYPQMHARVRQHLEESRRQAEMVEGLIRQLGGETSAIEQGVAKFMGNVAALNNSTAEDEVVKNAIADYAYEHFEIASYRSLIGAAEALGEPEVKRVCEEILRQEEAMAAWLEENLPAVTQDYLQKQHADVQAKR